MEATSSFTLDFITPVASEEERQRAERRAEQKKQLEQNIHNVIDLGSKAAVAAAPALVELGATIIKGIPQVTPYSNLVDAAKPAATASCIMAFDQSADYSGKKVPNSADYSLSLFPK